MAASLQTAMDLAEKVSASVKWVRRLPSQALSGKPGFTLSIARRLFVCICMCPPAHAQHNVTILDRLHPPLVAAHRGGEFGVPNTLVQFAHALESNDSDILEMDLRLTADGKVVVFHDDKLDEKSDCKGTVEGLPYAALLQCKLNNGERIALFSDVLALVDGHRLVSAELKTDKVAVPASELALNAHAISWLYFQVGDSRHRYNLVRALDPRLAMVAKADSVESLQWILAARDPYLAIVEIDRDTINDRLVRRLHANKKLVSLDTWRYQFSEERFSASCDRAFEQGVDIAVTNNPSSCHRQKGMWSQHGSSAGHLYDRQHVRGWLRVHFRIVNDLTKVAALLILVSTFGAFYYARIRRRGVVSRAIAAA